MNAQISLTAQLASRRRPPGRWRLAVRWVALAAALLVGAVALFASPGVAADGLSARSAGQLFDLKLLWLRLVIAALAGAIPDGGID